MPSIAWEQAPLCLHEPQDLPRPHHPTPWTELGLTRVHLLKPQPPV